VFGNLVETNVNGRYTAYNDIYIDHNTMDLKISKGGFIGPVLQSSEQRKRQKIIYLHKYVNFISLLCSSTMSITYWTGLIVVCIIL
jgi:hypothetical protein